MTNTSVVIVNYNSGGFLEVCVDSVCRSDCLLEIIIVDNASTDGSADFLSNFTAGDVSLQIIRNEDNRGFSAAINRGVGYSKSENVLLLNPDCLVFPHSIRSLCDALDADSSAGIVGGLVFNFDGSEQRGCRRREPTLVRSLDKVIRRHTFSAESNQVDMNDDPLPKQRIYVDAVSGSFLMIRRTTFTDIGGMDEGFFLHFEDLDLCRRVRDAGWKVVFTPDISIFHYQGGSSEHSAHNVSWEKHRSMQRYQCKHHGRTRWFRGSVFLLVWGHFLLQRTMRMVTQASKPLKERNWLPPESIGFPWMSVMAGSESGNRLLALGVVDELVRDVMHFGTTIGWSVYACNTVGDTHRTEDVHYLQPEYFDKVPVCDAPEFNALLIAPSSPYRGVANRVVEKFRVRRVAIIQLNTSLDRSNEDVVAKSFEAEAFFEALTDELMEKKVLNCETRMFHLVSSKQTGSKQAGRDPWDETIQDCFSWFSK